MIALRPIQEQDRGFLREVFASGRPESALLGEALVTMQFESSEATYAREAGVSLSVVVVDGEDAGRLYVARSEDEVRVVDITLLPAFRGRGIGTSLLLSLMTETPVALSVSVSNPARALYERLGFRVVQDHGAYLSMVWTPRTEAVSCSHRR